MTLRLLILFALLATQARAANWFVTPSGAGNHAGTAWTNAIQHLGNTPWSSVNPGDTIWISGGNYG